MGQKTRLVVVSVPCSPCHQGGEGRRGGQRQRKRETEKERERKRVRETEKESERNRERE